MSPVLQSFLLGLLCFLYSGESAAQNMADELIKAFESEFQKGDSGFEVRRIQKDFKFSVEINHKNFQKPLLISFVYEKVDGFERLTRVRTNRNEIRLYEKSEVLLKHFMTMSNGSFMRDRANASMAADKILGESSKRIIDELILPEVNEVNVKPKFIDRITSYMFLIGASVTLGQVFNGLNEILPTLVKPSLVWPLIIATAFYAVPKIGDIFSEMFEFYRSREVRRLRESVAKISSSIQGLFGPNCNLMSSNIYLRL